MEQFFCHTKIIIHLIHEIQFITWGNHRWKGAIPALIAKATKIINPENPIKLFNVLRDSTQVEAIKITEAMACVRKYLIADSVDLKSNSLRIRGINLIKLISSPSQHINHELADTAIIVPLIRKKSWYLFKNIKKEEV